MTPNQHDKFHAIRSVLSALALLCIGLLAACQSTPDTPQRTPTSALPASLATAQPPSPPLPPTPTPDKPITLTLWLPTRFLPQENNLARQTLQRQLADFARASDGAPSQIVVKQDHGLGGLLDLLRAASPVAPAIRPDIIALDAADLETAARAGLLQPIGPLLPADVQGDLFPFARRLGTINDELYGVLYSADLEHLVGNSSTPLPATWAELLDKPQRYLFALGANTSVSDAVLADYLSAGGVLTDTQGNPYLDESAVRRLLETYRQALDKKILPPNSNDLTTDDETWSAWRNFDTALLSVNATRYLSVETRLPNLQYAALPALTVPAQPIGRGWFYAVVTPDARRQDAAARLLAYLLASQNAGEWTRASGVLPGRAAALNAWDQSAAYTVFIRDQLSRAQPAPSLALLGTSGPALRKAIADVLSGRATPAEAARLAAMTVNQKP